MINNNSLFENLKKTDEKVPMNSEIEKLIKEKFVNENQFFLLLSIYFYLKHNNFNATAEILFQECNLGNIFVFPQEICDPKTEMDKLRKSFINYFYYNAYFKQDVNIENFDFLSDFWNQFWDIFVNKIKQTNQNGSALDKYLKNTKSELSCNLYSKLDNSDTLHK